jgi:hypothetical protein
MFGGALLYFTSQHTWLEVNIIQEKSKKSIKNEGISWEKK